MTRPYFILGTPRSRTAWLSAFLSTQERPCQHEPSRFLRDQDDLLALLRDPDAAVSDSALTFRWREIRRERPDARIVVVRRPLPDVIESAAAAGLPSTTAMLRQMAYQLDLLCQCVPVLSVPFHRLVDQTTCEMLYEFCVGDRVPVGHWLRWKDRNVQADIAATTADAVGNIAGLLAVIPELRAN